MEHPRRGLWIAGTVEERSGEPREHPFCLRRGCRLAAPRAAICRGRPGPPGCISIRQEHLALRAGLRSCGREPIQELSTLLRYRRAAGAGDQSQVLGGFLRAPVTHRHDRAAQPRDLRIPGGRTTLQHPIEQLAGDHCLAGLGGELRGQDERGGRVRIRRELPGDAHPRQAGVFATPQAQLGPAQSQGCVRRVGRQLIAQEGLAVTLGGQAIGAHPVRGVACQDEG